MILDADSRRVIGWALDRTLQDGLTLAALSMALQRRLPPAGLVHDSDRGVQYASEQDTDRLKSPGLRISMSRRGNPYDNAFWEASLKTLKYEEIHRQEARDLAEARTSIEPFLKTGRQPETPALGAGLPSAGGVQTELARVSAAGASMRPSMRFLGHGGIHRCDGVVFVSASLGRSTASRGPAPNQISGRGFSTAFCSSSAMSSGRVFLDRVARQRCSSPLHRQPHPKAVPGWGTMDLQRRANSVLTVCLSQGDNRRDGLTLDFRVNGKQAGGSVRLPAAEGPFYDPFDADCLLAATNAVQVYVGGRKIRSRESAEYFIRGVDKLPAMTDQWPWWRSEAEKRHVYAPYAQAWRVYQKLTLTMAHVRRMGRPGLRCCWRRSTTQSTSASSMCQLARRVRFSARSPRASRTIVYIPIGQLSPTKLKKIRVVHVLDSHKRRDEAKDYLG